MSYKSEFQANNADLQGLIDTANALPDHENLDSELATQDTLIANIMTALEGKTAAESVEVISGTATASSTSALTISALIGAENFMIHMSSAGGLYAYNHTGVIYIKYIGGAIEARATNINGNNIVLGDCSSEFTVDTTTGAISCSGTRFRTNVTYTYMIW